jgi:hypothetical protein
MQMTIDERRSRLIEWLEIIKKDLHVLLLDQFIFYELQKIIRQNPRFDGCPGQFTRWMASGYAQAAAVGVRRQVKYKERDKNSVSLKRFLTEVKDHPDLITRQYHIGLYDAENDPAHMGDAVFDNIAGAGEDRLPPSLIEQQIQQLNDLKGPVKAVEKYVDKRIAHYDNEELPIPTFNDISAALATMEKLVILYTCLLTGKGSAGLRPIIQDDWMAIFRFAWWEHDHLY